MTLWAHARREQNMINTYTHSTNITLMAPPVCEALRTIYFILYPPLPFLTLLVAMFRWLCWEYFDNLQHSACIVISMLQRLPIASMPNRRATASVEQIWTGRSEHSCFLCLQERRNPWGLQDWSSKLSFDMCTRWTQCEKVAQSILKYSAIKAPPSVTLSNSFLILRCVLHRLWLASWRTLKEMHCVGDNRKAISMFARWQHLWLPVRPLVLAGEQLSCATKVINHWTKPLIDLTSRNASPTCMAWRLAAVRAAWLSAH